MNELKLIEFHEHGNVVEFRLVEPQLSDLVIHDRLTHLFLEYVEDHKPKQVVVNFDVVRFCASGVIGSLLRLKRVLKSYDAQMRLCGVKGHVLESFESLNLIGSIFEVDETVADSIAKFA